MSSWYFVTTINKDGCLAKDSILILLLELNLPNAFTPNGDGENDIFIPRGNAVNSITEFSIFNRWGEKVFTSTDHHYGWDGKYKSVPQEMGTYVYVLKAELKNGVHKTLQGNFHLIR
jgi:gliding motility-associated-like protein